MAFTKILGPGIATDTNVQVGILTATKFYGDDDYDDYDDYEDD